MSASCRSAGVERWVRRGDAGWHAVRSDARDVVLVTLDTFRATHQNEENKEFYFYNDAITDANYAAIATTKLTPGRKFLVKVFGITERVSSDDCLAKIKVEKGTLVGAQGASLAY